MYKNKFVMAALGATACLSVPAAAADLAAHRYVKAPVYVQPIYDWSGFYVGAHVGYAWGSEHDNLSEVVGANADKFDVDGVLGGVHAGYNWQSNRFVFGVEGDFDGSGIKGDHSFDDSPRSTLRSVGNLSFKNNWQASLRARAGFAENNWLFYVTGGVAFADVDASLNIYNFNPTACEGVCVIGTGFQSSANNTLVGYTVGLGSEYVFSRNWIGRVEVRYTDFGSATFNLGDNLGNSLPTRVRFDQVSAVAGISYKF
jgi:outer membrane immunogenic protein